MTPTLPQLPKGDIRYFITDSTMNRMDCYAHSGSQLEAYALAAIKQQSERKPPELVRCPKAIIDAITAYGDARADQDVNNSPATSHDRLADCIRLMREALAAQQAKPLSDEQINEAYGDAKVQFDHIPHGDVVRIARAIERYHGIN